jgi:hypothetical protein
MATRLPLLKEKKGVLMSSTLKGVGTGLFRTTIMPELNRNRRRSRSSSRSYF